MDTSIDCLSPAYAIFKLADGLMMLCYLSILGLYIYLLTSERHKLNPINDTDGDEEKVKEVGGV